jgi:hypothetical protein
MEHKAHTIAAPTAALAMILAAAGVAAGAPDIQWFTVDTGGGISQGASGSGTISVNATIGQFDAGAELVGSSGGQTFTLVGGYWADVRCVADFNGDQGVDFFDYLDFVAALDAEDAAADVNGDGTVDFFDYLDFVQAFDAGC